MVRFVVSIPSFFLVWIVTDPTLISIDYYGWLLSRSTTQKFSSVSDLLEVSFVIDELQRRNPGQFWGHSSDILGNM
jgi:hypothetical protein